MKKFIILFLALMACFATQAQKLKVIKDLKPVKEIHQNMIGVEPVKNLALPQPVRNTPSPDKSAASDVVTVLNLGTSANANGYGYAGGQKTLLWADDNLNAVINIHRMGPGTNPPNLSGYLAIDLGINGAATQADWTDQVQIYNAVMPGGTYYLDAARYPQGAIYNPVGNTDLANAYCAFYAPNLSNSAVTTWGGISYGRANLVDHADTTKHMVTYNPPPNTYIPDGFDVAQMGGHSLVCDLDQDWESGSMVWQGDVIVTRGTWNDGTNDFDYTTTTLPCVTQFDNERPADDRIAFDPSGQIAWLGVLAENPDVPALADSSYFPILWRSTDAGLTWSDPIYVLLDGPDGICGVKDFIPDNVLNEYFSPGWTRDEIPYTTAFDFDLAVDYWGNPHLGVMIGCSPDGYSISTADSLYGAFDIYSVDDGNSWYGAFMGFPLAFRGTFGTGTTALTEDNRTQISQTMDGKYMFISWIDTQVPGVTDNIAPDIFCRGFDLVNNSLTGVLSGGSYVDGPNNVTFLSDVTQQSFFFAASHYIFTDNNKFTIPFTAEIIDGSLDPTLPVSFKYIPDFSYTTADFAFPLDTTGGCHDYFPVGIQAQHIAKLTVSQNSPNPFNGSSVVTVTIPRAASLSLNVYNITGQLVYSVDKGFVNAGTQQITINSRDLNTGVYFYTVKAGNESVTHKMIVQ